MKTATPLNTLKALAWFLAGLLLFLAVGILLSVSSQRAVLQEEVDAHVGRELGLLADLIHHDLLKHDYPAVKRYLDAFGEQHGEIQQVRLIAPDGSVLETEGRLPAPKSLHVHTRRIPLPDGGAATLEIRENPGPLHSSLSTITWRNIIASILFTLIMGVVLWILLRRTAFAPLERALEDGVRLNETLEQRVHERTRELMQANSELAGEIEERGRAEEALRHETRFIAAVLDTIGAIVVVLDREGKIVRFNRACEDVSGYAFEEVRGRCVWDFLIPAEQVDGVKGVFRNLRAGMFPSRYENYWVAKNGGRRLIAWSNTALTAENGRVDHVIATGIDITDSRAAEEALRGSEERYRRLFHRSPIGIFNYGTDLVLTDCNNAFVGILQTARPQLVGFDMNALRDQRVLPALTRALEGEEGSYEGFYRATTSGIEKFLTLRTAPLFDRQGAVVGAVGIVEDITERKGVEQALQDALKRAEEEKNKSEAIVAAIGDGISIQDRDFRIIYQNQFHRSLVGDHVGEFCYKLYHDGDQTCVDCPVARSYEDGEVHIMERRGTVSGEDRIVEVAASPLRDASGNIIAGIEVVRDITARKQGELTLIERSRHAMLGADVGSALTRGDDLQRTLQACAESLVAHLDAFVARIWTLNGNAAVLEMQASAGAYTDRERPHGRIPLTSAREAIASIAREMKPRLAGDMTDDAAIIDPEWSEREGIASFAGYPLVVADRLVGVMALYSRQKFSEATIQALAAVADEVALGIERKRMETDREKLIADQRTLIETVSRSHKEWRDTFDSIRDPIYITDTEYRIVRANKAFIDFVELSFGEVVGKKCYDLLHETAEPYLHCPHPTLRTTGKQVDIELVEPRYRKILVISHFPYYAPTGEFSGSISIARDVTEERDKEMRYIMNERLASLGQMAASIAHEINNPLAAILGCAEGLTNRVSQARYDPVLFRNYLKIIEEEVARCKIITTGMLSFVRESSPEKNAIAVHEIIDRTLEITGFQGRLKEVEVVKRYGNVSGSVYGSEGELKQVFLAVITNALDAMEDRGTLTVATGTENGHVFIAVSDTGTGVAPDNLSRIFEPFFTTKSERGGTGLGLSISRKIIKNHSGDIHVSSEPGSGATVTITLPVTEPGSEGG